MNPWDVPPIQKRIVETCKILGKPVVIATQMLERSVMDLIHKGKREEGRKGLSGCTICPITILLLSIMS